MSDLVLSDKGLSIFVFAAYHQLSTGGPVSEVVIRDGAGHEADPQGVREVESAGLAIVKGDRASLTDPGLAYLKTVVTAIQGTAGQAPQGRAVA